MGTSAGLQTRQSQGLGEFCAALEERPGLSILDFAPANQSTVTFVTGYGHRIYAEDVLLTIDRIFGDGDINENQADPERVAQFLDETLGFPLHQRFDGVLVWDVLQFLTPAVLQAAVTRLHRALSPGACLLAFFHSDEKVQSVESYSYRIVGPKSLVLSSRGRRRAAQFFNNRGLEKLFQDFHSVKFFLTRDHLREVIVRR
jgi:hypothetical protein